ncbi:MAG: hypothetical protein ABI855_06825 [Bacteroidota bacterium]
MNKLKVSGKTIVFTLLLVSGVHFFSFSQSKKTPAKDYSKYPYWIEMMDDSTVNYFEAVKAYDEFWANRKKPKEEDEIIGEKFYSSPEEKRKKSFWDRIFASRVEKQEMENNKYKFQCKKFEHWKFVVQPYVQPDGRILSTDEQLDLWKNQRSGN